MSSAIATLLKGKDVFVFRCDARDEPLMMTALVELVERKGSEFDWFDSAIVLHQLRDGWKKSSVANHEMGDI